MFLNKEQLTNLGLKKFGDNVLISDKASIYGADKISLGNNVRIDDFCILSAGGGIIIGDYVHIACYTSLIGKGVIMIQDFVDISTRVTIMSSTSLANGDYLTNPVTPEASDHYNNQPILIERYAVVYAGCIVLPGALIREGAAIGAMSLVKKGIPAFQIWAGNPIKYIRDRNKNLIQHAEKIKPDNDEFLIQT